MKNVSKETLEAANEHAHYVLQQLITRVSVYQEEKARIVNSAVSDFIAGAVIILLVGATIILNNISIL